MRMVSFQRGHSRGLNSKIRFIQLAHLTDGVAIGWCSDTSPGTGSLLARSPRALQEYQSVVAGQRLVRFRDLGRQDRQKHWGDLWIPPRD